MRDVTLGGSRGYISSCNSRLPAWQVAAIERHAREIGEAEVGCTQAKTAHASCRIFAIRSKIRRQPSIVIEMVARSVPNHFCHKDSTNLCNIAS